MARVAWSSLFVFALMVVPAVAPGGGGTARKSRLAPATVSPAHVAATAPPPVADVRRRARVLAGRSAAAPAPASSISIPGSPAFSLAAIPSAAIDIAALPRVDVPIASRRSLAAFVDVQQWPSAVRPFDRPAPRPRPAPLVPMYAAFATLQALDYHSTTRALSSGTAVEANPFVRPIADHPAGFIALKAGATVGMVWITERMWKQHPVQAVVFMAAANSAMALVVAHNYRLQTP